MVQIKFVKEIPIINGTYKKDMPDHKIGFQKFEVEKTYTVKIRYEVIHKTKKEAEQLAEEKHECKVDDYLNESAEPYPSEIEMKGVDVETEDEGELKKIEECIPREDTDYDTDKIFLNYEDPDWSKDDFEWYKNEDGTDIKKEAHGSTNT
jgi:hypothetical protein